MRRTRPIAASFSLREVFGRRSTASGLSWFSGDLRSAIAPELRRLAIGAQVINLPHQHVKLSGYAKVQVPDDLVLEHS
jgi:hypothetical protein